MRGNEKKKTDLPLLVPPCSKGASAYFSCKQQKARNNTGAAYGAVPVRAVREEAVSFWLGEGP